MNVPIVVVGLQVLCVGSVLAASLSDIATRTVSNKVVVLLATVGAATQVRDGHLVGALIAGAAVFSLAAWCWRRGWMGGADVKLLGAATLCIPPGSVPTFVVTVAIAGGLLAMLYLGARPLLGGSVGPRPTALAARVLRAERWRIKRRGPLPYACAIAAGLLFVIV
jgi:prepilin peptidase CpaA